MIRKIWRIIAHRYLLSIALMGTLAALSLGLSGHESLAHWVLIIIVTAELIPLLWAMIQDIRQGTYGVDILAATAIVTALIMHEYWAAMVIVVMLTGGESLEDYAEHRARRELDALLAQAPRTARILRGQQEVTIKVSEIRAGDTLVIRPGEVIPADAEIVEGSASVDESSLTGESLPVAKKTGAALLSGSINLDGRLVARALATAADSQYEQIVKLVRAAAKSKAPFVRLADHYAIPFTIISFGIAGVAWAWSGEAIRFLEVLVVATPCPLILAAPIAIISGMSRAAKHGIIMKTGSALEQLASARTFAFDKTGTLTNGTPTVKQIATFHGFKRDQVLTAAAALEQSSNHVLAAAILSKARQSQIKLPKTKHVQEVAGNGLKARVNGQDVLVGRLSLFDDSVTLPKLFDENKFQATAAFVAIGGKLAGAITFSNEVRPEAKSTLKRLQALGVQNFLMVTGDSTVSAKAVAKHVGIKKFFAGALPGDKIRAVEQVADRPVAFVGDGVNDAPVLMASDVGIALGARGSTAASESADVVVMLDDLERVATGRQIATRTFFIAKQSIFIGIGLSVMLMLVFATGKFRPIHGALIQELVDIVVIFNALRAHGSWARKKRMPADIAAEA